MELRQLRYFVKVAETLNFSEAARLLCVTQSTLSQQVKQLECELGSQLLNRTSHSVTLTEPGLELLPYARDAICAADLCRDRMDDLNRYARHRSHIFLQPDTDRDDCHVHAPLSGYQA